ncbi:thiol peroxidase [Haloplasma contractile]|uniref:Thiol peroxidase n=1 Tax=Haloplasma contractile SSD-17B TaxID=1033810 RepID=U2FJQ2_9MOLU|nr:thiol peroxidase [Haloplasma contractile]ERJ13040.1 putative thiol peroxidase protein [Haloplasma contractile SSD-17B]
MPTFAGNPLTLEGAKLKVGDIAPDFSVLDNDLNEKKLSDYTANIKVISVVPSLDTGVCDQQTRKFNQELSEDGVVVLTISNDLPFAQARWCGSAGIDNIITLSDHRDLDFANKYGTLVKELRLQTRAVFVLDNNNKIAHVEYLDEITNHPNYDAVINKVKELK